MRACHEGGADGMSFLATDLGVSDDAIAQITAQLANATNPLPINDAIDRQVQTVKDYTLRYAVADERLKRLVRALVLFDIYSNPAMGIMPPNVATMYKAAMAELIDIRDGKFHDLKLLTPGDPDLASADGLADWGSDQKVDMRRGGCQ